MKRFATCAFALAAFASMIACGAEVEGDEDLSSSEQHDEIKPTDKDKDKYGDLIIDQWKFSGLPAGEIIDPSTIRVAVGGKSTHNATLKYDEPIHLMEGDYSVTVSTNTGGGATLPAKVTRKKKTHFTLPLSAVQLHFADTTVGGPTLSPADFGVVPTFPTLSAYATAVDPVAGTVNVPFDQTVVLFSTAKVTYGWESGTEKSSSLATNKFSKPLGPSSPPAPVAPPMFGVKVEVPKRALPNYRAQNHYLLCLNGGATAYLPATTSTLHAFVQAGECKFQFVRASDGAIGGTELLTQSKTKTQSIEVKRIDVNDVDVKPETGGANYIVKGTFKVVDATNSQVIIDGIPTGYGIDVLPGKYYVEINYVVTGDTKTQKFTLDLR